MITKAKLKREIDKLPDKFLVKVYEYINSLKSPEKKKKKLHTFKLKGRFDNINVREKSYE